MAERSNGRSKVGSLTNVVEVPNVVCILDDNPLLLEADPMCVGQWRDEV